MYVCTSTVDAFSHVREINIKRNYCTVYTLHTTQYTVTQDVLVLCTYTHDCTGCNGQKNPDMKE